MANRYHNLDHQNSLNGPPKKPGLIYREQQVAALEKEARGVRGESQSAGFAMTGNVAVRQQLKAARSGLQRQRKLAGY